MSGYERIVFDHMKDNLEMHLCMNTHLQLYTFAHTYIYGKSVIDAACGTCFGAMIYSTGAKNLICVDKSKEAIEYGKKLPIFCPVVYLVRDLDKEVLPMADACVSIETLEHLDGKGFFLKNLKVKELIFSLPVDMPGGHHKLHFKAPEDGVKYLNDNGWEVPYAIVTQGQADVQLTEGRRGLLKTTNLLGVAKRYETKTKERRIAAGRGVSGQKAGEFHWDRWASKARSRHST